MKNLKYIFVLFVLSGTSCSKFIEIDPPTNALTDETAYQRDATATSVLTALYKDLAIDFGLATGGPYSFGGSAAFLTDEMVTTTVSATELQFLTNSIAIDNSQVKTYWTQAYNYIYRANAVLEGVNKSGSLKPGVVAQLTGEAKFIRAYMLFYMVNLFGAVPVPLTTDYTENTSLPRTSVPEVYNQIVRDLKDAQQLLSENYLSATNVETTDRVRPNQFVATALLARAYLFMEQWADAETEASKVIAHSSVYKLDKDLSKTFIVNSPEAIWQVGPGPNSSGVNTWDGNYYIALNFMYFLNDSLVGVMAGDKRLTEWTGTVTVSGSPERYPLKYKINQGAANSATSELTMMLRLAEQYFIRAEARAMQNRFTGADGANADLNAVRDRVDLPGVQPANLAEFMPLLEKERQIEFFTEWGHRWLDLKRWKGFDNAQITRADEVMPGILSAKGGTWKPENKLWPIPESEVLINVKLTQNPGY